MAHVVQKAIAINTVGDSQAVATFASPVTAGNSILLCIMAADHAQAAGSDGVATTQVTVLDSLGNRYVNWNAVWQWGDRTHNTTLLLGQYLATNINGGTDQVSFSYTPVSSAQNCHVGLVAYEVTGTLTMQGATGSEAATAAFPVGSDRLGQSWSGQTNGVLIIECGAAFTTDGSNLNAGSGYTLDAAFDAVLNGVHSTLGAQAKFSSSTSGSDTDLFGNSPSASSGVSSVMEGIVLGLPSAPDSNPDPASPSNQGLSATQAAPTFSPVAGTYTSVQSVTLTSAGASAIYYTTDGSTPTTGSTLYTGPVSVGVSETIKAIATGAGLAPSNVASAAYTINLPLAFTFNSANQRLGNFLTTAQPGTLWYDTDAKDLYVAVADPNEFFPGESDNANVTHIWDEGLTVLTSTRANVPTVAAAGTIYLTTDTFEAFAGTGLGIQPFNLDVHRALRGVGLPHTDRSGRVSIAAPPTPVNYVLMG